MPNRTTSLTAALLCLLAVAAPSAGAKGDRDRDHDGLSDKVERVAGTDPADRDSDDDGVKDGAEGAGVVKAIRRGRMTVKLFGGGVVTARLTASTDVLCPPEEEDETEDQELLAEADPGDVIDLRPGEEDVDDADAVDEEDDAEPECTVDDLRPGVALAATELAGRKRLTRWTAVELADWPEVDDDENLDADED